MLTPRRSRFNARLPLDGGRKVCVMCNFKGTRSNFKLPGRSLVNEFCNGCWKANRKEVMRFLRARSVVQREMQSSQPGRKRSRSVNRKIALVFLYRLAERRISRGMEVKGMVPEEYAMKVAKLPDRVAAIIGKTGAELGDSATLADDEALMMIRDLLLEIDGTLMERNKNKRLSRR